MQYQNHLSIMKRSIIKSKNKNSPTWKTMGHHIRIRNFASKSSSNSAKSLKCPAMKFSMIHNPATTIYIHNQSQNKTKTPKCQRNSHLKKLKRQRKSSGNFRTLRTWTTMNSKLNYNWTKPIIHYNRLMTESNHQKYKDK